MRKVDVGIAWFMTLGRLDDASGVFELRPPCTLGAVAILADVPHDPGRLDGTKLPATVVPERGVAVRELAWLFVGSVRDCPTPKEPGAFDCAKLETGALLIEITVCGCGTVDAVCKLDCVVAADEILVEGGTTCDDPTPNVPRGLEGAKSDTEV